MNSKQNCDPTHTGLGNQITSLTFFLKDTQMHYKTLILQFLKCLILFLFLTIIILSYKLHVDFKLSGKSQRDKNEDLKDIQLHREPNRLQIVEHVEVFTCPTKLSLTSIPKTCPKTPKHPALYDSSLLPLYPPGGSGPSTQTNGLRHVILMAIQARKSIMISPFTVHKGDHRSSELNVPFGLRVDIGKLCEFVSLTSQYQKYENNTHVEPNWTRRRRRRRETHVVFANGTTKTVQYISKFAAMKKASEPKPDLYPGLASK